MIPKEDKEFFWDYYDIYSQIDSDFGGGSPFYKTFLMAYLIKYQDMKTFVEIGVYKGKCLLPLAYIIKQNKGVAIGIDPYDNMCAREYDVEEEKRVAINEFIDKLNFNMIYKDVLAKKEAMGLSSNCEIINKTSESAWDYLMSKRTVINMLHIDGNHDTKYVVMDAEKYIPMVSDFGVVVFNVINWDSVNVVYQKYKAELIPIFECDGFAILLKAERTQTNLDKARVMEKKFSYLYKKLLYMNKEIDEGIVDTKIPTVAIGILTYNHEKYIEECLDGIFFQKGEFSKNVFIVDDCSTDSTYEKICHYLKQYENKLKDFNIKIVRNDLNKGVVKTFQSLVNMTKGFDYVSFCEGDDYWVNPNRVKSHIDFLKNNPECCMSFNQAYVLWQNTRVFEESVIHCDLNKRVYNIDDGIKVNIVGNQSCAFYDGRIIDLIPDSLFEVFIGDWMFNMFCATFGDIGYISDVMTIYRKHPGGIWTSLSGMQQMKDMIKNLDEYNSYMEFIYDKEYTKQRNNCIVENNGNFSENLDLVIIDDIFPCDMSGFRYQEFTSYLEEIENTKIMCTGETIEQFLHLNVDEVIIQYKRSFPRFSGKVCRYDYWREIGCKLMYFVFPTNAYNSLPIMEKYHIPFIFTLYPGGGFALNNSESDRRLKRLMKSPYFKKVIVTQQVTYDYLINNKFCSLEKIEFIFGGVMPLMEYNKAKSYNKVRYGFEKGNFDICFVAQKYTKKGEDKGYDVFIDIAKILCGMYANIHFHVVGRFDENDIDISNIKNHITFYGTLNIDNFDSFFTDKDIILSPNIDGKISYGTFDGFPTGSCVEAGLRKTAIFCTDPLNLNGDRIVNAKEIVIIPHDAKKASEIIEYYYKNPQLIKDIGDNCQEKLLYLFSYEYQIAPRIKILKDEIKKPSLPF
ncbi:glycosyltransferase [Clostridium tagluense]|uniref:glycosyltransferase n=1 Tax=Clostridium tagluense TaxID=360422 RepID=UPI001C6E41F7|nr:glycosyltransferase [Clostridium tagluense]MBW9158440.1 glycosyltransferase [Clostridium tagluense]WLC66883.1 glycosyltransferase [Clostridium tagluense]